ncbi:hypothetical protein P692DRAFT_20682729, partial [Suillus brevipes Sb2]
MPGPTSNKAPTFSGETSELLEFFEHFEDLADACSLTDTDKCKLLVRYVDTSTKRFWVTLKGYDKKDFNEFKTSILAQYPGAEKGIRYTIRDLERIVINNVDSDISTETELLQYYRQFRPVAVWLVTNNKITARERDRYFWQGLPLPARKAIDRRLELKTVDYNRNEPTDFEEVLNAGHFVFSDEAFDADFNDPIATRLRTIREGRSPSNPGTASSKTKATHWDSDDEDEPRNTRREVQTKTVRFTPSTTAPQRSAMDEVEELARKMHGLDIEDVAYSGCY